MTDIFNLPLEDLAPGGGFSYGPIFSSNDSPLPICDVYIVRHTGDPVLKERELEVWRRGLFVGRLLPRRVKDLDMYHY